MIVLAVHEVRPAGRLCMRILHDHFWPMAERNWQSGGLMQQTGDQYLHRGMGPLTRQTSG